MNSSADWLLQVDPQVHKDIKRFPKKDVNRILEVIEILPINPYAGDIQKMTGEDDVWRRRVGEYRVFFEIIAKAKTLHVFRVERRTSKTY